MFIYRWYRKPGAIRVGSFVIDLPEAAVVARHNLLSHWERIGRPRPHWAGLVAHASTPDERELAEMLTSTAFGKRDWSEADTTLATKLLGELGKVEPITPSENV